MPAAARANSSHRDLPVLVWRNVRVVDDILQRNVNTAEVRPGPAMGSLVDLDNVIPLERHVLEGEEVT